MKNDKEVVTPPPDHFANLVQKWSDFGPPLRPSPDDTEAMQGVVSGLGHARATRALLLGLTPEIVGCSWPQDIELLALDHSAAMLQKLWPPERRPQNSRALLADWCAMPIDSGTVELVAGDGCHICLSYPERFTALAQEVRRVLSDSGRFAIRVFMRPDQPESVADIGDAMVLGRIGSVHALKLRLLGALHGASGAGTCLDDVWQAWQAMSPPPVATTGARGWTPGEITGIEAYRGMAARYYLPTLEEFRAIMSPTLTEIDCSWGRYELADRCPTLIFARHNQD
jgi:SAM-dependent methyltransferase